MDLTSYFRDQLEREVERSHKALERVPEGKGDWKPHSKSMPLGYLATLVATMPSWLAMMVERDDLDLNPPEGKGYKPPTWTTNTELLAVHEGTAQQAREALAKLDDARLATPWRLLVGGHVVDEKPRHAFLGETFNHLAHHRGQLTVYLRLNDIAVPAIYGPSADDRSF